MLSVTYGQRGDCIIALVLGERPYSLHLLPTGY